MFSAIVPNLKINKHNTYWRKALLFAKILVKLRAGHANQRDSNVIRQLLNDPGVSNRLIEQAHWTLKARKTEKEALELEHAQRQAT